MAISSPIGRRQTVALLAGAVSAMFLTATRVLARRAPTPAPAPTPSPARLPAPAPAAAPGPAAAAASARVPAPAGRR